MLLLAGSGVWIFAALARLNPHGGSRISLAEQIALIVVLLGVLSGFLSVGLSLLAGERPRKASPWRIVYAVVVLLPIGYLAAANLGLSWLRH